VSRRVARNAVIPASGTQPSNSTSVASHGLPPNKVDRVASTAMYAGVLAAEPMPVSWYPARYSCHRLPAPLYCGTSAPPPNVADPDSTEPVSDRSATSATTARPAKSRTPGLVSTRRATESVAGSGMSSPGSSTMAWCSPPVL
jgi:hypothetical protein